MKISWRRMSYVVVAIALIAGCAADKPGRQDAFLKEWKVKAERSRAMYLTDADSKIEFAEEEGFIQSRVKPEAAAPAQRALPTLAVTNMTMARELEVPVVLRALAKAADINIIFSDNVKGMIRFSLNSETTWDQVFLGVLRTLGLEYRWEGDMLRVMSREDIMNDLAVRKMEQERLAVELSRRDAEPLMAKTVRIRYADANRLGEQLQSLLTDESGGSNAVSRGSVEVDKDNNTLVLNAVEPDLLKLLDLIRALDRPRPQVLIQANIVQANRETARELGVQWGGLYSGVDGGILRTGSALSDFPAGFTPGTDSGLTLGFLAQRIGQDQLLTVQLTALQNEGLLNILSTPSITTLDNEMAMIESGEERPYKKTTGGGVTADTSIEWKKAVLKLEVTPHVVGPRGLMMEVYTTKDDFDDTKGVIIDGVLQVPMMTKKASTRLFLADGETTVIGGLSQESKNDVESGIPFLKDIPLLGYLFKSKSKKSTMNETLIFITPHILPAPLSTLPAQGGKTGP
jgi:type IV pilus assembly protein PilQ